MPANILILGGTGNIGAPLVSQLTAKKISVRLGQRIESKKRMAPTEYVESTPFDFSNPKAYARAFEGIQKCFLLTPAVPNQLEITQAILEQSIAAGVKTIVKLSAFGTGPQSPMAFGRWHYVSEKAIEDSGLEYTFLRPNGFMQNFLNSYAFTIKKDNVFYASTGEGKVSFVDCRDVASCAAVVLTETRHDRKSYDLTGSEAISNSEAATILSGVLKRPIKFFSPPKEKMTESLKQVGLTSQFAEALVELYTFYSNGGGAIVRPHVEQLTGKRPRTFREFATEFQGAF